MSCLLVNGLKSVTPRGYQGSQGWLWWALNCSMLFAALLPDEIVIGGGNLIHLKTMPEHDEG